MADLIVRGIGDDLVMALKQRAARMGRSAEAEHRKILERALRRPKRRHLAEVLAKMPDVGRDQDFARIEGASGERCVPD